jgi:hypothetical protein
MDCPHLLPQSGDFEHGVLSYTFGCFSVAEIAPLHQIGSPKRQSILEAHQGQEIQVGVYTQGETDAGSGNG